MFSETCFILQPTCFKVNWNYLWILLKQDILKTFCTVVSDLFQCFSLLDVYFQAFFGSHFLARLLYLSISHTLWFLSLALSWVILIFRVATRPEAPAAISTLNSKDALNALHTKKKNKTLKKSNCSYLQQIKIVLFRQISWY